MCETVATAENGYTATMKDDEDMESETCTQIPA